MGSATGIVGAEDLWPAADYRERWRRLPAWLDVRAGERVLDVGFGGGQALRAIGPRVGARGRAVCHHRTAETSPIVGPVDRGDA